MKRVLTAAVLIPVVLFLVFLGPRWHWLFSLAVAAVAALAAWEFMSLTRRCGANPPRLAMLVALVGAVHRQLPMARQHPRLLRHSGPGPAGLLHVSQAGSRGHGRRRRVHLLPALYRLHADCPAHSARAAQRPLAGASLLCAVWAGDIAAYYVGRAWGRHKLAPKLSPGKTWEGASLRSPAACWSPSRSSDSRTCCRRPGTRPFCSGWNGLVHRPSSPIPTSFGTGWCWRWCQRRRPGGRSGRVGSEALGRRQGFRHPAPRPWRSARPHRRPAAGRSGAVVRSGYSPEVLKHTSSL